MLLSLFVLSLLAALRGWFPLSLIVFGAVYGFNVTDFGTISAETSLSQFGIGATAGPFLEYVAGGTLAAMILFERA